MVNCQRQAVCPFSQTVKTRAKELLLTITTLTTREVARLLHVSNATVKRWADDGLIDSEKTVGGHRRFLLENIARLRKEGRFSVSSASRSHPLSKTRLKSSALLRLILSGSEQAAADALIGAYLNQQSLPALFDSVISDAMHLLGDEWFAGSVSVVTEHRASRCILNAVQRFRSVVIPAESKGLKAICCGVEGELHELAIHLAEILLESDGWETINLGPNTPLFSLITMVALEKPQLVCISSRQVLDLERATMEYKLLRKAASKVGARIVLGGEAFRDRNLVSRLPADLHTLSFAGFNRYLRAFTSKVGS